MNIQSINNFGSVSTSSAVKYLPEPAIGESGLFHDFLNIAKAIGNSAIGGIPTMATGSFSELINAQLQAQTEMQTTTMVSNIEKSKHESKMSAVRNIRVS